MVGCDAGLRQSNGGVEGVGRGSSSVFLRLGKSVKLGENQCGSVMAERKRGEEQVE